MRKAISRFVGMERNGWCAHYWLGPIAAHVWREGVENYEGWPFNRLQLELGPVGSWR